MKRILGILSVAWLITTSFVMANPVHKTMIVNGIEREYLVYAPTLDPSEKAIGMMVCLHGFGRSMNDFFDVYDVSDIAESLKMLIVAPQALPEQDPHVLEEAEFIGTAIGNPLLLNSVWGCGLRINATLPLLGMTMLDEELNKEVDDVHFIDQMINEVISDYSLPAENIFVIGTSMGGFMTYQYAVKNGERLSGIISIAGSMGLNIQGLDGATKIPVCDFHSITDEVVPYTGSYQQFVIIGNVDIALAKPKEEVINYWRETNATGAPITEQIEYYTPTNDITVEKITYPDPVNEVIHYKINGAPHSYFFKKENGDCMDHVEEITQFIESHLSGDTYNTQFFTDQQAFFYPNPVVDRVKFNALSGVFTIYDMTGRSLLTQSFLNGQADLSGLKSGMYIIRVQTGNTFYTGKLIKRDG